MMRTIKTIFTVLMMVLIASPAMSQMTPKHAKKGKKMMAPQMRMWKQLNLSEDQKEQIKEIRLETQSDVLPHLNKVREYRAKLRTLTTGENADFAQAESVVDQMSEVRSSIQKRLLQSKKQIRDILNEEQKLKFDMIKQKMKKHNHMRRRGMRSGK